MQGDPDCYTWAGAGGAIQWPQPRSVYIDDPNGYEVELSETWGGGL